MESKNTTCPLISEFYSVDIFNLSAAAKGQISALSEVWDSHFIYLLVCVVFSIAGIIQKTTEMAKGAISSLCVCSVFQSQRFAHPLCIFPHRKVPLVASLILWITYFSYLPAADSKIMLHSSTETKVWDKKTEDEDIPSVNLHWTIYLSNPYSGLHFIYIRFHICLYSFSVLSLAETIAGGLK